MPSMLPVFSEGFLVVIPFTLLCSNVLPICSGALGPPLHPWAGAQALSPPVPSLQEIKMDILRGRVRTGSRFSREAYIPARTGRWHAGPGGARVGGAATPLLLRRGTPRPPKQPSLCCLRGPAQQFHFPGGRREIRKKGRTLRPRGPGWRPPLLRVSGSTRWLPCAPPGGGQASDFHGSRPSQQHFGLRRDTERWGLRGVREKSEGRGRERSRERTD